MRAIDHLTILPVVLPLAAAAIILLFEERRRTLKAGLNVAATALLLVLSIALVARSGMTGSETSAYRLGDWPAPFAIVLVAGQRRRQGLFRRRGRHPLRPGRHILF